jgi:MFS family permease
VLPLSASVDTGAMSARAVATLGIGQLVNWGVLYYAFAVLLQPVQAELGRPAWAIAGAFSLALLVSAAVAPVVGRWSDRGHAATAITLGGATGAVLLGVWALVPGLATLYLVWAGLGVCMAASLYEPAFALVTRTHASADGRLRALAAVTLFGGLASTLFLPLTAGVVAVAGWRGATIALAVLLALSAALMAVGLPRPGTEIDRRATRPVVVGPAGRPGGLAFLAVAFGASSFASAAFVANLVPALGERGIAPTTAAVLGGLFGVLQLPGRAVMASPRLSLSGPALMRISLGLQALGLFVVAAVPTMAAAAFGVATFAAGSGLTTLARPYLVQSAVALEHVGSVNGGLARTQQLTRACGPLAAAGIASVTSQWAVLMGLGGLLALLAWLVRDARGRRESAVTPTPPEIAVMRSGA